jgi:hypothetical protein
LTKPESTRTVQVKDPNTGGDVELTTLVTGNCKDGDCPKVYRTDRGTIGVQGYVLDRATPDGEALVEIPAELLLEAARALGG